MTNEASAKGSAGLVIGGLVLIGCILAYRSYRSAEEGVKSVVRGDTQEFVGVLYNAPKGARIERSTVPGEVKVTITKTSPKPLKVELMKEPNEINLAGMKHAIERDKMGTNPQGEQKDWGWVMTYDAASGGKQHELFNYRVVKKKNFHCVWNESTTVDQAAADAICASLRPAPEDPTALPSPSPSASASASGPTEEVIHPTRLR